MLSRFCLVMSRNNGKSNKFHQHLNALTTRCNYKKQGLRAFAQQPNGNLLFTLTNDKNTSSCLLACSQNKVAAQFYFFDSHSCVVPLEAKQGKRQNKNLLGCSKAGQNCGKTKGQRGAGIDASKHYNLAQAGATCSPVLLLRRSKPCSSSSVSFPSITISPLGHW